MFIRKNSKSPVLFRKNSEIMSGLFYVIIFIFCLSLSGCRYKEEPLISFHSVEKRLEGTWKMVGLTSDGVDSLKYYNDKCGSTVTFIFRYPDGSPMPTYYMNFDKGKIRFRSYLTFVKNKKEMKVYYNDSINNWHLGPIGNNPSINYWKIVKLTEKEFKTTVDFNGKTYIISFKKE